MAYSATGFRLALISANPMLSPYPVYPLALSYLSSHLRQTVPELDIELLDVLLDQGSALTDKLRDWQPHFIGLSLRNIDDVNALSQREFISFYQQLIEQIRTVSSAEVILGGAGFSLYPQQLFRQLKPDFAIIGEGELALEALLKARIAGQPPTGIAAVMTPECLFPTATQEHVHEPSLTLDNRLADHYLASSGMLSLQTKRGCPYRCSYCSYPVIDGRKVRTLDPEQIVENLVRAKREQQVSYVFFTDSVFNIAPQFNERLAEAMIHADLGLRWSAYFSPARLRREQLALYQAAGLTHIEFGTESLCDETLERYRKPFHFKDIKNVSDWCNELGIYYAHFLILAGWGDSRQNINTSLQHARRLKNTVFFPFFGMRIYPHTQLRQELIAAGELDEHNDLLSPTYYQHPEFDESWFRDVIAHEPTAWSLPDDDWSGVIAKIKKRRSITGPAWHYLCR